MRRAVVSLLQPLAVRSVPLVRRAAQRTVKFGGHLLRDALIAKNANDEVLHISGCVYAFYFLVGVILVCRATRHCEQ